MSGDKWIDFDMPGLESVVVDRIAPNKVLVTIETTSGVSLYPFNSIGTLNFLY